MAGVFSGAESGMRWLQGAVAWCAEGLAWKPPKLEIPNTCKDDPEDRVGMDWNSYTSRAGFQFLRVLILNHLQGTSPGFLV